MASFDSKKFFDFAFYADTANPKHREAYVELFAAIEKLDPTLLTDDAEWVKTYREKPPVKPVLAVPYFSQRDNYRDAARTCFSSSCAMLCETLKPGTLPGAKGDDKYVQEVFKRGDSTDASVQIQTLKHFGINASFKTNGTLGTIDALLAQGIPVPIGILHHGPANAPSGGGHWLIVVGKEGSDYIVNDPWGEITHSNGTYPSSDGKLKKYSKALLDSRWTVASSNDGWYIHASK
jgi:hypothetical protein